MPASTFRAWTLGIIWAILIAGMNQFFYFRYPSVAIGGVSGSARLCVIVHAHNKSDMVDHSLWRNYLSFLLGGPGFAYGHR